MKVKELIEALQKCDPEMGVYFERRIVLGIELITRTNVGQEEDSRYTHINLY